jgi:hypothetical protein
MQTQTLACKYPLPLLALAVLLLQVAPAQANDPVTDPYWEYRDEVGRGEFSYDDSEDVPWIENQTAVPEMPVVDDMHRLNMDLLPQGFELFVDRDRITVDPKDSVVRMWLWLRNSHGNETGTFEGFRCDTGEYKVYAYANPRRTPPVRTHKRAKWRSAEAGGKATYRSELLADYLCGIRGTRPAREIRSYMTGQFQRERFLSE